MADLIQSPMGQQMSDAAGNPIGQLQTASENQPADPSQSSGSSQDPRPIGTEDDANQQKLQQDPNAKVPASPRDQAEYTQLVTRFVLMIHDMRRSHPGALSPTESTLKQLNNPNLTVAQAVGNTTAQLIFILHNAAKHMKVQYSPDVLFHGADECAAAVYLLGLAAGIFKGTPPFKGVPKEGQPYPFDQQDIAILGKAKIAAVQHFGKLMESQGMITDQERQQAMGFWQQQITHEVNSGKVDESVVQKMMNDPKIVAAMQAGGHPQPGA